MPKQDEQIYQEYLSRGINTPDDKGITPLMWAASDRERTAYSRALISQKADLNVASTGYEHKTALSIAATEGNITCLRQLLSARADVNKLVDLFDSDTALTKAIRNGRNDCAKLLILEKADLELPEKKTPLDHAVELKNIEMIQLLLRHHASLHNPVGLIKVLSGWKAHLNEHLPILKEAKALNVKNASGETLLSYFARKGNLKALSKLLEEKVNLDTLTGYSENETALTTAINYDNTACAKLLINSGANFEIPVPSFLYKNSTALSRAIARQNKEIVGLLLARKAVVYDAIGLLKTLSNEKMDLKNHINTLKEANAINVVNDREGTLLSYFVRKKDSESVQLLIEAKADLNTLYGYKCDTALTIAIDNQDIACATLLVEAGADFLLPYYRNPLDVAVKVKNLEMINLLLCHGAFAQGPTALLNLLITQDKTDPLTYGVTANFIEQQAQGADEEKRYDSRFLSSAERLKLKEFFSTLPEPTTAIQFMHGRVVSEIDQQHHAHHFPFEVTKIVADYDEYRHRLFQPRTSVEIALENENTESKKQRCIIL